MVYDFNLEEQNVLFYCNEYFNLDTPILYQMYLRFPDKIPYEPRYFINDYAIFNKLHIKNVWTVLSFNLCLTPEFIQKHINKPWNWNVLSSNPVLNDKLVENNLHCKWNWGCLANNTSISLDLVKKYSNVNLEYIHKTRSDLQKSQIFQRNDFKEIQYTALEDIVEHNLNITCDFVCNHSENLEFDRYGLSRNPSLTPEIILFNLNEPWNWNVIDFPIFRKHLRKKEIQNILNCKFNRDIVSVICSYL